MTAVFFAIPILIGLAVTLAVYFVLRLLMEDVDT